MILNITYKIQHYDSHSGKWKDLQSYPSTLYNEAHKSLYKRHKIAPSLKLRLIQIKEEILDSIN